MIEYRQYLFTAINNISLKITKKVYNKVLYVLLYINDRSQGEHNLLLMKPHIVLPEGVGWSEIEEILSSKKADSVNVHPSSIDNKRWLIEIDQKGESGEDVLNIAIGCREIKC